MILGIDFETCSAVDVRRVGSWQYSCHPSTRVHCGVFVFAESKDGPRETIRWTPSDLVPERVIRHIGAGGAVLAHNVSFEKSIIANTIEFAFPVHPRTEQWHDTSALAQAANLPNSLEGLAAVLKGAAPKDKEGNELMKRFAKVTVDDDGSFVYPEFTEAEFERLLAYCEQDVHTMLDCWFRLPQLSVTERLVWLEDQRINERGVHLDVSRAATMSKMASQRGGALDTEMFSATGSVIPTTSSVNDLREWLTAQGIELPKTPRKQKDGGFKATPTAGADVLRRLHADPATTAEVKRVLALRLEAAKLTSLAKLKRVPELVGNDGRLRHALQYCAASTGRWASRGLQLHNLPRDKLGKDLRVLFEQLVVDDAMDVLSMVHDEPLAVLSQLLRTVIVAKPGHELLAADFSAIEARVLAWLAGQDDKVKVFHDYDATAGRPSKERLPFDPYVIAAAKLGSTDRQLGKVSELALGYGMGARKYAVTALGYGVKMTLGEARTNQLAWRANNPAIARRPNFTVAGDHGGFWYQVEDAFRDAITTEHQEFKAGRVHIVRRGACVLIVLPSGRSIRYWRPSTKRVRKKIDSVDKDGNPTTYEFDVDEIRYFVPEARGMLLESAYGGKLVENITQAVARDLLAEALLRCEDAGFPVVMHVHDAILSEVPLGTGDVAEFCKVMSAVPSWAAGCPVAVEGYRDTRFRK